MREKSRGPGKNAKSDTERSEPVSPYSKQAKWATEHGQSRREQLKENQEINGVTATQILGKIEV